MTRLMLYTFHGPNRTGERESAHLHEGPWVMTGPLVVLGALSVAGGALNVPALFRGHAWLEHWLEPVTAVATRLRPAIEVPLGTEWTLVIAAVAVAALGIFAALRLLRPEELVPARLAPAERGFARLLWKKWYVDEIYDFLLVRPLVWLSREVLWKTIDLGLIDGAGVHGARRLSHVLGSGGMQVVCDAPWIQVPLFGTGAPWSIRYSVGVDGISLFMVLLTTLLVPLSVLGSYSYITTRERAYYALLLVLTSGMIGVFVALDLFLFYVMWEVMLIPMYFIIGVWGGDSRLYAAIRFFIYTMFGSLLMLVAILALVYLAGQRTGIFSFDYFHLMRNLGDLGPLAFWLFAAFFLAFAIKVPMFPFHTWLPDAHVEAPTAGSVILARILLKMGTYGFLRFAVPFFPALALSAPS